MLFMLLLIAPSSAILNTKTYDAVNKEVTIKDWLGLSGYLTLKLLSNTEQCLSNDCEAVLKLTPAQDMKPDDAIGKAIKFVGTGGYDLTSKVTYSVSVEQTTITKREMPVWGTCDDEKEINKTTGKPVQYPCKTGTKEESTSRTDLVSLHDMDTLKAKTDYIIHIKGTKPTDVFVDWQIEAGGIKIPELAWWNSSWVKKKDLVVYNPDATPRNKEVFIYYLNDTDITSQANAMFADLRIVNDTGGVVPHQLIYYRQNLTADAILWVSNYLPATTGVNYSIYYNNTAATLATNVTLFDRYDFFENSTIDFNGDGRGVFNTYDSWSKLAQNKTATKAPAGTDSIQSLDTRGSDATADNNAITIDLPFKVSWWANEGGTTVSQIMGAFQASAGNRHGMWARYTLPYILTETDGGTTMVASTSYLDSYEKWYWFAYEVNATGEYYFYRNETGIYLIASEITAAAEKFGDTGAWSMGTPALGTHAIFDNLLISHLTNINDWNEYVTSSYVTVSPEQTGTVAGVLTVSLSSPANGYKTKDTSTFFNCSAVAGTGNTLKNATLTIYTASGGTTSYFEAIAGNPTNYQLNRTQPLSENGAHKWNCKFEDSTGLAWATNRTFTIDNVVPVVNVIAPVNGTTFTSWHLPLNVTLNATSTDATIGLDACWWSNISNTKVYPCNTAIGINFTSGSHNIYFYANDTLNNTNSGNSTTFFINYVNETAEYTNPIPTDAVNVIAMNISANAIANLSGTLWYNGTAYTTATYSTGAGISLVTIIPHTSLTSTATKTFYWNYTFNGLDSHLSNNYTQIINALNLSYCNPPGIAALNFTLANELTFEGLKADFKVDFRLWQTNPSGATNISFIESGASSYYFCLNNESDSFFIDADIKYGGNDPLVNRYYYLRNLNITNNTQTYMLYTLDNGNSTTFKVNVLTAQREAFAGGIVKVLKQYIGLNDFKNMEECLTDNEGNCLVHLVNNIGVYKFVIERSGTIWFESLPKALSCNTGLEVCSASVIMSAVSNNLYQQYATYDGVQYYVNYNNNTRMLTYFWNDPTGKTQRGNLQIIDVMHLGKNLTLLNHTSVGATGAITFNFTGYNGTYLINAYIGQSPDGMVAQFWLDTIATGGTWGLFGLFFGLLIVLVLYFINIWSPRAAIIGGFVGIVLTMVSGLWVFSTSLLMGTAIIILLQLWRMR